MRFFIFFLIFSTVLLCGCSGGSSESNAVLIEGEPVIINNDGGAFSLSQFFANRSIQDLEKGYFSGDLEEGYLFAVSVFRGYEREKNKPEGVKLLTEMWRKGVVDAGYHLYEIYSLGLGVDINGDVSLYYLQESAKNGYIKSQRELGFEYAGRGRYGLLGREYDLSIFWFLKAAEQGDKIAAVNLAGIYHAGKGVERDDRTAFEWISKVEELPYGNPMDGFSGLAKVYEEGIGTDIDLVQAYKYYDLLSPGSAPDRARLEEQMTPEQIREAIRLSRQWQEEHNIFVSSYYGLEYQEDGTFQ